MKFQISVTILTKNSETTLAQTLDSLTCFEEVLVYDTGSSDDTLSICKKHPNVRVEKGTFAGFGPTHNTASSLARFDWILSIDSDEIVSDELINELQTIDLQRDTVYSIRRHNFLNQKRIFTCSGWNPDYVIRLYHRKKTSFSCDAVHEKILQKGCQHVYLKNPLYHTPYRKIADFLGKMQSYSELFAEQNQGKKTSSLSRAILHGSMAFIKSYIFKLGFIQGREGFIISLYNSHLTYYKYLKLSELKPKIN